MTNRDVITEGILIELFTKQFEENTIELKLELLLRMGWTEQQVLVMLETMALELARENGNTWSVIRLIASHKAVRGKAA